MKKRYNYFWSKAAIQITGIVFLSQFAIEISGAIQRKPGFEWVVPACGFAFAASVLWAVVLIVLNARNSA